MNMVEYNDQEINKYRCRTSQKYILQDLIRRDYSLDYRSTKETVLSYWPDINKYQGHCCMQKYTTHSCFIIKHIL